MRALVIGQAQIRRERSERRLDQKAGQQENYEQENYEIEEQPKRRRAAINHPRLDGPGLRATARLNAAMRWVR